MGNPCKKLERKLLVLNFKRLYYVQPAVTQTFTLIKLAKGSTATGGSPVVDNYL